MTILRIEQREEEMRVEHEGKDGYGRRTDMAEGGIWRKERYDGRRDMVEGGI